MDSHEKRIKYLEGKLLAVTEQAENVLKLLAKTIAVIETMPGAPAPFPITENEIDGHLYRFETLKKR